MNTETKINPSMIGVGILVLALIVAGLWYLTKNKEGSGGVVQSVEEVSDAVPEISTNPAEDVPEVNPVDRANPFKYDNPLR
ncbi:MAG: hypothetical protein HY455_01240 [Parcubacteria group bacterium]|nr:hypothetical protein [Parcubacteria group bacterium]